ncbi:MAG: hypothetical protein LUD27_00685 [Clostridia bacterium]|nr:hypothetical protein [Clostridia bacterium]
MDINVTVTGQTLIPTNIRKQQVVAGTQEFIRFVFALAEDWADLKIFAQFTQNDTAYSVYLDSDNAAYLPSEITTGAMAVALQGNSGDVIAKSMPLIFKVYADPVSSDSESTSITLTLYEQLVAEFQEIKDSEASRVTAESARVSAETARVTEYNSLVTKLSTKLTEVENELADIKEAIEALNSGDGIQIYYDDDERLSYDYTE